MTCLGKEKKMVLVFDIVTILIGTLSVFLCGWAILKPSTPLVAKLVSGATGLAILFVVSSIYVIRYQANQCTYRTKRNLCVVDLSKLCESTKVSDWEDNVFSFWTDKLGESTKSALDSKKLICLDSPTISIWGRVVRGYVWGSTAVVVKDKTVGTDPDITRRLVLHELGHFFLFTTGDFDEKSNHKRMKEAGWNY
jgi:ABC-type bacteriocin/lantibiotic exporter with double-glycine peptidase domain